jgi:hypothetical protein
MRQLRSKSFRFRFSEEFRGFQNSSGDFNKRVGGKIGKKFCFALRLCIYRIFVALQTTINLNPLQRLNEAYPDHSFLSLVVRRETNPPWRTWRLRSVGAEAV